MSASGSSQMRIAYSEPNTVTLPTPVTRAMGSLMSECTKSAIACLVISPSPEMKALTSRKLSLAFSTLMPCWRTTVGRRGSASASLF
ncbi:hypothetical protein KBTX_01226 [wastewater metagenome]|uniref:Uncharacterized protein n=2 Tax=unclassified sequences TaxID=12908 RepID=A0A5B8RAD6_9ZZZZ|nr:hypothetical protein KBTEX_01226 [uncultured organism]